MKAHQIRSEFLEFFAGKGHTIVPSSPVVPHDDPTLMFANAGMNQFKDVFLGSGSRGYTRAADTQKCIRAGGKHNDLDDVGQDTYHHTFFEMLGNWSFGDYFKEDAIRWAWELLTKVWGIPKERLHATYFAGDAADGTDPDNEAADLWRNATDIVPAHIHPGDKKDNFWEMGDTGPCGPCSEIHVDLTPDLSGAALVNAGDARVIELWNLVFIQFNRNAEGVLNPLPARHVDTGMGFERLCAVLQGMESGRLGQTSNYDTDVFVPLFSAIRDRTAAPAYTGSLPEATDVDHGQRMVDVTYRVIADHLRCLTFALTDGVVPSNEGRGYVLRRILRRATRYGRQYLDMHEPFLCDLVEPLARHMGDAFPELHDSAGYGAHNAERVAELIRDEEASFLKTLDRGIKLFEEAADRARGKTNTIDGADAFRLHDTFGFPIDLTERMAEEAGLTVDQAAYEKLMEEARERARSQSGRADTAHDVAVEQLAGLAVCDDSPKYDDSMCCDARITRTMASSMDGWLHVVTDQTCFYAEQGGQVGDVGRLSTDNGSMDVRSVRRFGDHVVHSGVIKSGSIKEGQACRLEVDAARRRPTMSNHTSTHLLNWALREVLEIDGAGKVDQKGSLVDANKTRFDFSHHKPLADQQLDRVEQLVQQGIEADLPVYTKEVDQADARRINTLRAVFGEQYPDRVRVVSIGADIDEMLARPDDSNWMQYSVEFCGGTHLGRSREADSFVLTAEESVAKGIRRVIGVSGVAAHHARFAGEALVARAQAMLAAAKKNENDAEGDRDLANLQAELADLIIPLRDRRTVVALVGEMQELHKARAKAAQSQSSGEVREEVARLLEQGETISGVAVVAGRVSSAPADALRSAIDWVRSRTDNAGGSAVFLATAADEKVTLIAGMSRQAVEAGLKAGDLIKETAPLVGGRGGGRPDMAQGGGSDPAAIDAAVERARSMMAEKLG